MLRFHSILWILSSILKAENPKIKQIAVRVIFIVSVLILITFWLKTDRLHTFHYDPHNKAFQSYSIATNDFVSEALIYSGNDFDQDRIYDPTPFKLKTKKGIWVSAFPVAWAYLTSPFALLSNRSGSGYQYASIINVFAMIGIWLLLLRWNLHPAILLMAMWGNFLWLHVTDFSELPVAVLLGFAGLTLYLNPDGQANKRITAVLSGLLIGSAVFFRPEMLAFGCLFIAITFTLLLLNQKHIQTNEVHINYASLLWFTFSYCTVISIWLIFNNLHYDHLLGPRFQANASGIALSFDLRGSIDKIRMLFLGNASRPGYLAYMPILIVAIIFRCSFIKSKSLIEDILTFTIILFLLIVSLIAPNDGFLPNGQRYLAYAILPTYLITNYWLTDRPSLFRLAIVWFLTLFSFILPYRSQQLINGLTKLQGIFAAEYQHTYADIWIFANPPLYYPMGLRSLNCECYLLPNQSKDTLNTLLDNLNQHRTAKTIAIVSLADHFYHLSKQNIDSNVANNFGVNQTATLHDIETGHIDFQPIKDLHPDATVQQNLITQVLTIPAK